MPTIPPSPAVDAFRRDAIDKVALALGVVLLPGSVVNAAQSWDTGDRLIGVAGMFYLFGGISYLHLRRRQQLGDDVRSLFFFTTVATGLATELFETSAGSSHFLGLVCVMFVVAGEVTGRGSRALLGFATAVFPAFLFLRQLYRPHPLLVDPWEMLPQAAAGAGLVFGMSWVLQRMIAALADAAERAREAERAKDRFLQNMSHELRTPLNAIIGYAELLEEEIGETEDLQRIQTAGRHLVGIVNDLLDLTRIEHDTTLTLVDVDLAELVEEAVVDVRPLLSAARNELVFPDATATVRADPVALRRVLVNQLGNAAKFTQAGQIRVVIRTDASGIELRVEDTGDGFEPAMAEMLFQPFVQADDSSTRRRGGTGLGLAISRALARAMGADLTATGAVGRGATFTLRWPTPQAAP